MPSTKMRYILRVYNPEKRNHNAPAIIFRVFNSHFYPIDNQARRKSILKAVSNHITQSEVFRAPQALAETKFTDFTEIQPFENVENPAKLLVDVIHERKVQPLSKNIYYDGEDVRSFQIDNTLYTINQDTEILKSIYEKHLKKTFQGQSISTLLFDIIELTNVKIPKSSPNPHVYNTLIQEGVKSRTHYGCVNDWTEDMIRKSDYVCLDIAKCYSKCMYDPYDDWIVLGFNDTWEEFDGYIRHGLYYVETDDNTLFRGSNIYSSIIVQLAIKEKIDFTITKQCNASFSVDKSFFRPILDKIKEVCAQHPDIIKK